jgi:hypothetical protein
VKEELKRVLAGGIDLLRKHKQITGLRELGFLVEIHRKHLMLIYKGKKRDYKFTVSKTPSDNRGTNNLISDICRKLAEEE